MGENGSSGTSDAEAVDSVDYSPKETRPTAAPSAAADKNPKEKERVGGTSKSSGRLPILPTRKKQQQHSTSAREAGDGGSGGDNSYHKRSPTTTAAGDGSGGDNSYHKISATTTAAAAAVAEGERSGRRELLKLAKTNTLIYIF